MMSMENHVFGMMPPTKALFSNALNLLTHSIQPPAGMSGQKEAVAKAAAGAAPVKRPVASPAASKTLPPVVSPPIKSPDAKKVRLATSEPDEEEDPTPNTLCDSPTPMASSPPGEKGTPVTPRDLTPEFDAMLAAVDKTPVSAQRVQEVMVFWSCLIRFLFSPPCSSM